MIRVIKRYDSRKLYDTEESRYISLDDIAQWVREGQDVRVLDNSTSADVTSQILTQVIHDEGKRGKSFLSTELLHELVRAGEKAVHTGVEHVQGQVDRLVQASIDRLGPVRRAREEMANLRDRLAQLETTLESLEGQATAAAARAAAARGAAASAPAKPAAAKAARSAAANPAAKRAAARKPAAKKTAAKSPKS